MPGLQLVISTGNALTRLDRQGVGIGIGLSINGSLGGHHPAGKREVENPVRGSLRRERLDGAQLGQVQLQPSVQPPVFTGGTGRFEGASGEWHTDAFGHNGTDEWRTNFFSEGTLVLIRGHR